jgi:hypothetical protein
MMHDAKGLICDENDAQGKRRAVTQVTAQRAFRRRSQGREAPD